MKFPLVMRGSSLLIGLLCLAANSSPAQTFTRIYDASVHPATTDAIVDQNAIGVGEWTFVGTNPTVTGGVMTTSGNVILNLNDTAVWNGASPTGSTFEVSLRSTVPSPDIGAANYSTGIVFGDNAGYWDTRIVHGTNGAIVTYNGGVQGSFSLDTTVFNTYRMTISTGGVGTLYVNNNPAPALTLSKLGGAFNAQQLGAYTAAIVDG